MDYVEAVPHDLCNVTGAVKWLGTKKCRKMAYFGGVYFVAARLAASTEDESDAYFIQKYDRFNVGGLGHSVASG